MYMIVPNSVFRWLTAGIACWIMSSCGVAYKTLRMEVLEPAGISIYGGGKIAFLNRKTSASPPRHHDYFSEIFYSGIEAGIADKAKFDSLILLEEDSFHHVEKDYIIKPLQAEVVNKVCIHYDVDYIISLEYSCLMSPNSGSEWIVYLYAYGMQDFIDSVVYRCDSAAIVDVEKNVWSYGILYANHIAPHWVGTKRRLYFSDKDLKAGYTLFRKGDLEQAEKRWLTMTQFPSVQAVKAAINLAWLYESSEELEKAEAILLQAQKLAQQRNIGDQSVNYLEEYLAIIRKRMRDNKLLINQLNT